MERPNRRFFPHNSLGGTTQPKSKLRLWIEEVRDLRGPSPLRPVLRRKRLSAADAGKGLRKTLSRGAINGSGPISILCLAKLGKRSRIQQPSPLVCIFFAV